MELHGDSTGQDAQHVPPVGGVELVRDRLDREVLGVGEGRNETEVIQPTVDCVFVFLTVVVDPYPMDGEDGRGGVRVRPMIRGGGRPAIRGCGS